MDKKHKFVNKTKKDLINIFKELNIKVNFRRKK